jgi:hypothetical protein
MYIIREIYVKFTFQEYDFILHRARRNPLHVVGNFSFNNHGFTVPDREAQSARVTKRLPLVVVLRFGYRRNDHNYPSVGQFSTGRNSLVLYCGSVSSLDNPIYL